DSAARKSAAAACRLAEAGRWAKERSAVLPVTYRRTDRTSPSSCKQQRRQSASGRDRQRVCRTQGLEELDQLFAGRLVIPAPVAADDLQQFVDRLIALVGTIERHRQVRPRLMIIGILLQAAAAFAALAATLPRLLCQLQRRPRGRDRSVLGQISCRPIQHLPRFGEVAGADMAFSEPGDGSRVLGIMAYHLPENGTSRARIVASERLF